MEVLDKLNAEQLFSKLLSIRNTGSVVKPIGWFKTDETILVLLQRQGATGFTCYRSLWRQYQQVQNRLDKFVDIRSN